LLRRLSTRNNEHPEKACRPFDEQREGTVISEGGGLIILEELEHARRRGARIYAELAGFGASTNSHSWSEPHPQGQGIALAIRKALRDAGLEPDAIDLVSTFGTGVPIQDVSEARGIRAVLGDRGARVPAVAIKGATGNNGAGSGAIDLAVAALCMKHNMVPPAVNLEKLDPQCDLRVVSGDPIDVRVGAVVSVAYALGGGQNAALVLRKVEA
jgi:3-oxoacyl-[acyl-carrier-protein] synthase II